MGVYGAGCGTGTHRAREVGARAGSRSEEAPRTVAWPGGGGCFVILFSIGWGGGGIGERGREVVVWFFCFVLLFFPRCSVPC